MSTLTSRIERMGRVHRRGNWLLGCGIILAIVFVLLIGTGIFVAMKWRGMAAGGMRQTMTAMIAEMPIDDAEKARTQGVVDDFVARFEAGDVTLQQVAMVMQEIIESPVLSAGMVMGLSQQYFKQSGLSEAERAEGQIQVARVAHGLASNTVPRDELVTILMPLQAAARDRDVIQLQLGNRQIRVKTPNTVTDDELRAFLAKAREHADGHGLPPVPPAFDLSGELDRAIRTAMGEPLDEPVESGVIEVPADPHP